MGTRERDERVVLITAPDQDVAGALARDLVDRRLAACVNIVPEVRSVYRWEGEVRDEPEVLLVVKSTASRLAELTAWIEETHPYDVPEVVALPIVSGSAPYLRWLREETGR